MRSEDDVREVDRIKSNTAIAKGRASGRALLGLAERHEPDGSLAKGEVAGFGPLDGVLTVAGVQVTDAMLESCV